MKIIRVSGCHDCPYTDRWYQIDWCMKANPRFKNGAFMKFGTVGKEMKSVIGRVIEVDKYDFLNKTLPDNCPLEDEQPATSDNT
ncbi:MAG TPA: hypothetical protein ENH85_08965 [Candidatus Scalindua sp.]|nr:hypothetical protein [Candidatus Scalindua sp.]